MVRQSVYTTVVLCASNYFTLEVRNRAKELAELLMDVEKIRAERRKAKQNRNKYVGVGSDAYRYGGFGNSGGGGGGGGGGSSGYGGGYDRGEFHHLKESTQCFNQRLRLWRVR